MQYTLDISLSRTDTIKEQLENQGVYMTEGNYKKYEKIKKSIHMLGFHICTESETKKNWDRFYKKITKDIYDEPVE